MIEPEFLHFQPYTGPGEPGFYRDFLGVRTRIGYMHLPTHVSGHVFGYPERSTVFLHYQDEWLGLLRSVLEAKERLVAMELGAGWGPWLVAAAVAARRRCIKDIRLVGVEGSAEHVAFMRQHFIDNDLRPEDHTLLHCIVGPHDGVAHFPVMKDATVEWGAEASFSQRRGWRAWTARLMRGDGTPPNMVPVICTSLTTLLAGFSRVDIIHCDIQGAEADVISAALPQMTRMVRRIVVGTHSRGIEDRLIGAFLGFGWRIENETACIYNIVDGRPLLKDDGTQVWSNPHLVTT